MKKLILSLSLVLLSQFALADNPKVALETNQGTITLELFAEEAPITVKNFLSYIDSGFYEGTQFHRVINGFMIQGGGFTPDMVQKETQAPIKNESDNGLSNKRGTISMARTQVVDSATSQFFINLVNNVSLDFRGRPGYAVFGRVIEGMEVVDKIAKTKTTMKNRHRDVPVEPIVIESAKKI